jgi:hypothetical protein
MNSSPEGKRQKAASSETLLLLIYLLALGRAYIDFMDFLKYDNCTVTTETLF